MQFTEQNTKKWVQEGIQSETIDAAFIAGWNLVFPNNMISSKTDIVKKGKKERRNWVTEWSKKFNELSLKDIEDLRVANKGEALTTSQIRIAFGEMRRIQQKGFKDEIPGFLMLKPKLAYAVKRHDKRGIKEFYKLFSWAYDSVNTKNIADGQKHFKNFMEVMESILAYHKYHGGKEN